MKARNAGRNWRIWQAGLIVALAFAIGWGQTLGMFAPADDALRDLRFRLGDRPVTGEIVLVEIDPKSLAHFGVWPWPRHLHAEMIDRLVEYGAYNIAFDVDFSAKSTREDDAALAAALDRAGGFVILASFAQLDAAVGGIAVNVPIPQFMENAWGASVNVVTDSDGKVRRFPMSSPIGTGLVPSLPAVLTGATRPQRGSFFVDFSIDAARIDRISYIDVLNKEAADERLRGKNVIVGAGAVELRDNFAVPRFGTVSGPMLQALAAETLLQSRQLRELGPVAAMIVIGLLGIFFIIRIKHLTTNRVVAGIVIGVTTLETASYILQSRFGLFFDTAAIHVAQFTLVFGFLANELDRRLGLFNRAAREKAVTQAILDQVITDNFDGVVVVDDTGTIRIASRFAEELLGSPGKSGLAGSRAMDWLAPDLWGATKAVFGADNEDVARHAVPTETWIEDSEGTKRCLEFVVTRSAIGAGKGGRGKKANASQTVSCLTFRDVTERYRHAERLKFLAHHDPLTGAMSRARFTSMIGGALEDDSGRSRGVTVGILDLRRFKEVNDTLGHTVGDMLLKEVVQRIEASDVEFVARMGGDSFAVGQPGLMTAEELETACLGLIGRVSEPYALGEHRVMVGANIGVTDSFVSGTEPDMLLAHADMALSAAAAGSSNSFRCYSEDMDQALRRKQEIERALRHALAHDELWVAYQPQLALGTGELTGVEALVRWTHPEWGLVTPDQFIPVAEETGQILELGRWVLERSCRDAAEWPIPITVAVNVSPTQFELSDVKADIERALRLSGLPSERLDIEITEGSFLEHRETIIETLKGLRRQGIGIALDDFGTGYSTLSYLGRLPIDKIKIDRSFVSKLPDDKEAVSIVQAVLALAGALGKAVVAEGIEDKEQDLMLSRAGCHIGQGYYYGRPMPLADLEVFMAKQRARLPVGVQAG